MKDVLDERTLHGIRHYGGAATERFYKLLKAGEFQSTRCKACSEIAFPPRSFCPSCHHREVGWVDLPRRGTIYAFTQQDRAIRFMTPDVVALIELEGVGRIFSHVKTALDELAIGDEVELTFVEVSDELTLHAFAKV